MNLAAVEKIAKALLYEGYVLYPYRASAVKNRQRFNFGVVYPQAYSEAQNGSEPCLTQTECLVQGDSTTILEVRVRFLHLIERAVYELAGTERDQRCPVDRLDVGDKIYQSWEEAAEREICVAPIDLGPLQANSLRWPATSAASRTEEPIRNARGEDVGAIVRTQRALQLMVDVKATPVGDGVTRISVQVRNLSEMADSPMTREKALLQAAISAHTILGVENGAFISLLDPGEKMRAAADGCKNIGGFPVLIGASGQHDTLLASPIILYDYPEIAAESAGDLFDSTEIDEILSLRIMTLTDEEKREVRSSDDRARKILERTENLPQEQIMKLHGALRGLRHVQSEGERAG
jgi:hydrogenase maturation protease